MVNTPKESEVQKGICEYLLIKHHFFFRNNNTPIWDGKGQKFRAMPKFTMRGIPDIIVIYKGNFIGIEVKRDVKSKTSPYQDSFKEQCEKAGGTYFVACSIEDVIQQGL